MGVKFIFARDNCWIKKYYHLWKRGEGFGSFILIGPSGSGKSLLVREVVQELGKSYRIYTGDEIEQLILKQIREHSACELEKTSIIVFEDIDRLMKSSAMCSHFENMIRQYEFDENGDKRLILTTAIDFMTFQLYGQALPVNPLKITLRVVYKKAKQFRVKLTLAEMLKLSKCKRISQLESELRKLSNFF